MKRSLILLFSALYTSLAASPAPTELITPDAGPRVVGEVDIFLTAEFLWWKARQDGLGYAISGLAGPVVSPTKGRVHHPNYQFEPGFKVGLGFGFKRDGWDIYARYTWLREDQLRTSVRAASAPSTTIAPYWFLTDENGSPLTSADRLIYARGDWELKFNVIDGELGRNFYISQYLTLRPFVGLKATWQGQEYRVAYDQVLPTVNFYKMKINQTNWGIGLRTGINTSWFLSKFWSVYGDVALTALWSDFDSMRKDQARAVGNPIFVTTLNTKNDFNTLKPVGEIGLGLRYQTYLYENLYHILFQAGWEEQIWWSQNQFVRLFEESAHGDLVFQGFTAKFRLDF